MASTEEEATENVDPEESSSSGAENGSSSGGEPNRGVSGASGEGAMPFRTDSQDAFRGKLLRKVASSREWAKQASPLEAKQASAAKKIDGTESTEQDDVLPRALHPKPGPRRSSWASIDFNFEGVDSTEATATMISENVVQQDAFRGKFLSKLAYNRIWAPHAPRQPKHQTVIIFDWDDTLLCTSWLNRLKGATVTEEAEQYLRKTAQLTKTILETAVKSGHTYIITNAMHGWVEYSAAKWAPELLPILQRVRIISARDKFQPLFPDDVNQWKVQAFLEVQKQLDWTPITNLIALGDADFEMEAARIMGGEFDEALLKTVKFKPEPSPIEHFRQLELVAEKFVQIVRTARCMRVVLEKKGPKK